MAKHLGASSQLFLRQIRTSALFNPSESVAYSSGAGNQRGPNWVRMGAKWQKQSLLEEIRRFKLRAVLNRSSGCSRLYFRRESRIAMVFIEPSQLIPMFNLLRKGVEDKEQLVALTGIEPVF
jgi:hypothetical protein